MFAFVAKLVSSLSTARDPIASEIDNITFPDPTLLGLDTTDKVTDNIICLQPVNYRQTLLPILPMCTDDTTDVYR